jgi:FkbM family methyltransferase
MVTLIGLIRTFTTLKNPLAGLPYQGRKELFFRNGWKLNLTYAQFRNFRDSYSTLKKYNVRQASEKQFEVDFGSFKVTRPSNIIYSTAVLQKHYQISQIGEDVFRVKGDKFELEGTSYLLMVLAEQLKGDYSGDCTGKVVLDIGGFQGETAVLFALAGAKKIVVYEPVPDNVYFIKKNAELNHINVEVHDAGIGSEDSAIKIQPGLNEDYFYRSTQPFDMKIRNVANVISESKADVAKIDCEGAEICLVNVPSEVLRLVPCYFIELHGEEVRKVVTEKFLASGFRIAKNSVKSPSLSVVTFIREESRS